MPAGEHQPTYGAAQDPGKQDDDAGREITCPECGGSGKQVNGKPCPKCRGKGKVHNFGNSMLDQLSKVTNVYDEQFGEGAYEKLLQGREQAKADPRVQAVQQWAHQNYNNGADTLVEAFEPDELLELIGDARTPQEAIQKAKQYVGLHRERENDVRGYGDLAPLPAYDQERDTYR